jgi:perosamine synthetase
VFVDIDPNTWCLDVAAFERAITPRTKAVIAVNLYGNMPDYKALIGVASQYGIAIVEDAAESIGSTYCNRLAGSFGEVSTFSFHGSKTMTTGEGGMLVTDRQDIFERCLFLRDHGRSSKESRMFWNGEVAYKYRMSSMQAALGLAQLERIEELVARKRQIYRWYQEELDGVEGVVLNHEAPHIGNSFWMTTVILAGVKKEEMVFVLRQNQIDSRPFFYPLSELPAFAHLKTHSYNPVAVELSPFGINLPSALSLSEEQVRLVARTLVKLYQAQRVSSSFVLL